MPGFYYLEVTLQLEDNTNPHVQKETFKECILTGIEAILGEFGTCTPIDVVSYDPRNGRGVLRCSQSFYKKLRAVLTLTGEYRDRRCCFVVCRVSKTNWLSTENTTVS